MEFSGPVLIIWGISKYVLEDPWIFALSLGILQGWYAWTHNEITNLPHVKHHRGCATGYFIYFNHFYANPSKEQVRVLIPPTISAGALEKRPPSIYNEEPNRD